MSDDILGYIPALRAYARALCRSVPDADDLVQETLLRAIENAHRYQPGTNMRAWLLTIMRNRFFTNCQKAARERTGAADCVSLLPQVKPDQEWHLQAREMAAALRDMPVHYREAIILVGALGESYLDTARILGCDIGTVKSRVNRARALLRKVLEPAF
ncbi:sigma-70 family RNA polymerase sigma factor [Paracoccus sp. M683]|uniref:sigma-70 family RNA polymerase sigma factor n=1 Tax=Paracoccus sp. M683 TaxID=2594268 RepID=UPI00117D17CC|nr:sigma-70 family RNA polymerase sigma factor [Paracoccus sp. M683]TRW93065.1 sigma-70 family RNA polymerase sigma factor [Paracoccus sp. M683]